VQIVEPETGLAFVSVAWPGMLGVVSGMNEQGIWVSVNGARAGEPRSEGVPIVFATRAVLEEARSLDDALAIIARYPPMVSHILFLADGKTGESMIVERAPNLPSGVVRYPATAVVSNHFRTAPLRDDPTDARIREITSTEARQARMEELLRRHYGRIDPQVAVAILRDRSGVGDTPLPLGNRNAVDALVATHSVVADLTARVIWVSEGPNTLGPYRRFDLGARLRHGEAAAGGEAEGDLGPDPLLTDEMYERYCLGMRARAGAEKRAAEGRLDAATDLYRCALAFRDDDHLAWRGLALAEERLGHAEEAQSAWSRVLALVPDTPEAKREAEEHLRPQ
jgi:isopenicillin-N N-acyltransferase like protein